MGYCNREVMILDCGSWWVVRGEVNHLSERTVIKRSPLCSSQPGERHKVRETIHTGSIIYTCETCLIDEQIIILNCFFLMISVKNV